jgi:hypothetical protein
MRAKTTIYLDPRQAKLLALIAGDQKVTQAELIRRAIDQLIESTVLPLPTGIGQFEQIDDTVQAANVKDWIRQSYAEKARRPEQSA